MIQKKRDNYYTYRVTILPFSDMNINRRAKKLKFAQKVLVSMQQNFQKLVLTGA